MVKRKIKLQNRISHKFPIKTCEMCGHKFRRVDGTNINLCPKCEKIITEENER